MVNCSVLVLQAAAGLLKMLVPVWKYQIMFKHCTIQASHLPLLTLGVGAMGTEGVEQEWHDIDSFVQYRNCDSESLLHFSSCYGMLLLYADN
jgi:hypothetical protein